jgi:hypothetical protein
MLDVPTQMKLYNAAMTTMAMPSLPDADVAPQCCMLTVFALERRCPLADTFGPSAIRLAMTVPNGGTNVRRCTAAKEMKLDFAIYDLCDTSLVKWGRFKLITSFKGEDPKAANFVAYNGTDIQDIIRENYPNQVYLSPPSCSLKNFTSAIIEVPWSGGMCRLYSLPDTEYTSPPTL